MHTVSTHKFDTEPEALKFAQQQRETATPSQDKYVTGPYYMDHEVILKDHSWNRSAAKWWQVTVEQFS